MSGGGIEAVLAAHWCYDIASDMASDEWLCECGETIWNGRTTDDGRDLDDEMRAHVAAQVLAWLDARLAEGDVIEAVAGTFMAPEHAPMSDHHFVTGECQTCPWPARHVLSDADLATSALSAVRGVLGGEGS